LPLSLGEKEELSQEKDRPASEADRLARELAQAKQKLIDEIIIHERVVQDLKLSNIELRKAQDRTNLMLRSVQMAGGSLELDLVLERIAEMLAFATGMPHCGIYLLDEEKNILVRRTGTRSLTSVQQAMTERLQIPPAEFPLVQEALESRKAIICEDARTDPRVNHDILPPMDIRSMLVIPIRLSGRVLGMALNYTLDKTYALTQEDVDLAGGVANSVALAVENARLYGETRQRLAESQGIQRVTTSLLRKNSLQEVLEIICNEALNLTDATGSAVLLQQGHESLQVTSAVGEILSSLGSLPINGSLAGQAFLSGKAVIFNDVTRINLDYLRDIGINTLLVVPLRVESNIIGVLDVINKVGGFTKEDLRIITLFADQAAIVIDQTQLHQQVEQMAVMEERQRLARELHDSVTQALYSVNLYAEAARRALKADKKDTALDNLKMLREMTREALLEMRLLVFELHPSILKEEGLVAALQARLAAVESRSGLKTGIHVEGERRLPLTIEEELYRIAQEGLNNAVKHAHARSVWVNLFYSAESICMELNDDGSGFDTGAAEGAGGMGLPGIKERVRKMGGRLEIESNAGQGTKISVTIQLDKIN
jgi:signal transduction histidine kinase